MQVGYGVDHVTDLGDTVSKRELNFANEIFYDESSGRIVSGKH